MEMTYLESKKRLDEIRKYNEMMCRMAISHLMDVGIRHFDEESIENACKAIQKEDDSKSFMTNNFKCDLIRMAGELAKIEHIHLLVYIQREIAYDVFDDGIPYKRAIELLRKCMEWTVEDVGDSEVTKAVFDGMGFDDEEIETLGFGYLLEEENEDDII
jgi:hypothetical protein